MNHWVGRKAVVLMAMVLMAAGCRNEQPPREDAAANTFVTAPAATTAKKAKAKPLEQPASIKNVSEQILHRTGYTVSYNKQTRLPNWVAWHLTADHCKGEAKRDGRMFHEDEEVNAPRATDHDYYNSRYDRGHLCPAGDCQWSEQVMDESFLFTNVCPQNHAFNEGVWNDLEKACRRWAREYGDVYIVCGPILGDQPYKTIGRNRVVVPKGFFKVVLCMGEEPKAIGFVYDNNGQNSPKMFSHAVTVDEVERLTGINFFPQLADDVEEQVESTRGYF